MKEFSIVTRYVCLHCKNEFKTATRHDCKRDPEKKNCYTCKYNTGWDKEECQTDYGEFGILRYNDWYPICALDGYGITAQELSNIGYKLDCPKWERKEEENE